jgi:hypothetical protein
MIRSLGILSAVVVFVWPVAGASQTGFNIYQTRIVEERSGRGLADAMVYAYRTDTRTGGGASRCDASQTELLDVDSSERQTGSVRLHIRTNVTNYMAVYCKPGYVPEFVKNSETGSGSPREGLIRLMRRPS